MNGIRYDSPGSGGGLNVPLPSALGEVFQATGPGTAAWTRNPDDLLTLGCQTITVANITTSGIAVNFMENVTIAAGKYLNNGSIAILDNTITASGGTIDFGSTNLTTTGTTNSQSCPSPLWAGGVLVSTGVGHAGWDTALRYVSYLIVDSIIVDNNTIRSASSVIRFYDNDLTQINEVTADHFNGDYIDLEVASGNPSYQEGRIFYDYDNKTLAVYNNESDVLLQLGQEIYIRVYNDTVGQIDNGTLVYISGVDSGRPTIDKAQADDPSTTGVIAMATHDISASGEGFVTVLGSVGGLDTNTWTVGTILYLSDSSAGDWTSTAPTAPSFPIQIGTVIEQSATTGRILVNMGETNVARTMVIEDLEINEDLRVDKKFTLNPSATTDITAGGGITVTNATMRIQGSGGPVEITANPQIAAGTNGQIVHLHGSSDTNTVTINDGNGLHLHSGSKLIIGNHDHLQLQYDSTDSVWEEVSTNFATFDTGWSWHSPASSNGTYYVGGFYVLPAISYTPSATPQTLGTANVAYGAHAFIVIGASSTDMVVRVTGTSIDEAGNRVTSDTEDLDTSGGSTDDYFETTKKWIGQVGLTLQSGTGVVINHGLCKYWDNQNSSFRITGIEITGTAGATDSGVDFELLGHDDVGWTYGGGAGATPPAAQVSMATDYSTESNLVNGENFAWKRVGLSVQIDGDTTEGVLWRVTTTANRAVEACDITLSIRPS